MAIDFHSISVGAELDLPRGRWEEIRPIYEQCNDFASQRNPRPQFEFSRKEPHVEGQPEQWTLRRVR